MMASNPPLRRSSKGRFVKGQSGNPAGRPKGTRTHVAELRRAEENALTLACHTADVIAETVRWALTEIERPEFIPLFDAICDGAKKSVRDGEIGPSPLAMLRPAYDDFKDNQEGDFFVHVGLPVDCDWPTFAKHYRTRGRIDFDRFLDDFQNFPSVAQRLAELTAERLLIPANADPSNKLEICYD
jgi:hypothetical protein